MYDPNWRNCVDEKCEDRFCKTIRQIRRSEDERHRNVARRQERRNKERQRLQIMVDVLGRSVEA